ncbi:hypothetical protein AGLY_010949 [Aphis glycines]|uniref:Uncharacterized protein n=1 Tax=Aphis glycines TaxID=307491 RepID=A0A6G0TEA0_APHGL|nr:hypothetical protein AGLY_010949 [Aphis glycines]
MTNYIEILTAFRPAETPNFKMSFLFIDEILSSTGNMIISNKISCVSYLKIYKSNNFQYIEFEFYVPKYNGTTLNNQQQFIRFFAVTSKRKTNFNLKKEIKNNGNKCSTYHTSNRKTNYFNRELKLNNKTLIKPTIHITSKFKPRKDTRVFNKLTHMRVPTAGVNKTPDYIVMFNMTIVYNNLNHLVHFSLHCYNICYSSFCRYTLEKILFLIVENLNFDDKEYLNKNYDFSRKSTNI